MEIDNEIFSTVILSLLLIQEGHFSVSGSTDKLHRGLNLSRNSVVR